MRTDNYSLMLGIVRAHSSLRHSSHSPRLPVSLRILACAAFNSACACSNAASLLRCPTITFCEHTALPSGVRAPVECFHGFQVWISSACRTRCSSVHCLAAIFPPSNSSLLFRMRTYCCEMALTIKLQSTASMGFRVYNLRGNYELTTPPSSRATSRQSRAMNATPPARRMRSRKMVCSGRNFPFAAFTSTPSNRPSRSCPSTSGQPGQPKRTNRLPILAAPLFIRSHHATAGCAFSAIKTSLSAAASGLALFRTTGR